ncbi:MAG: hypothetical protein ACOYL3_11515 [Desulfuromonadaceae bacterium]
MKLFFLILIPMVFFSIPATDARADTQKIQVAEFTVTGADNAGELKTVLKNLLSRCSPSAKHMPWGNS